MSEWDFTFSSSMARGSYHRSWRACRQVRMRGAALVCGFFHRLSRARVARDVRTGAVRRLGRTDTLPERTGRPRRFSEKQRLPLHLPTA
eukprot:311658-Chlamydomonas_euryale.AAC.3